MPLLTCKSLIKKHTGNKIIPAGKTQPHTRLSAPGLLLQGRQKMWKENGKSLLCCSSLDMHVWGGGSMALHRYRGSFSVVVILPHITVNEAILCSVCRENQNQAFYVKQEGAAYWIKPWGLAKSIFRNHTGFQKVLQGIFMINCLCWQPATHFLFSSLQRFS